MEIKQYAMSTKKMHYFKRGGASFLAFV